MGVSLGVNGAKTRTHVANKSSPSYRARCLVTYALNVFPSAI